MSRSPPRLLGYLSGSIEGLRPPHDDPFWNDTMSSPSAPSPGEAHSALAAASEEFFRQEGFSSPWPDPQLSAGGYEPQDACQDILMRLAKSDPSFVAAISADDIRRLTMNRCRTIRGRSRRRPPSLSLDLEEEEGGLPVNRLVSERELSPGGRFDRDELGAALRAAVSQLPAAMRATIDFVYLNGLGGPSEAAQFLGMPVGTVTSLLHRARRQLRANPALAAAVPM